MKESEASGPDFLHSKRLKTSKNASGWPAPPSHFVDGASSCMIAQPRSFLAFQSTPSENVTCPMSHVRTAAAVLIAGLLIAYSLIFYQLRRQVSEGYSDFISFYTAGKILQRGAGNRLYDLHLQYEIQKEVAPHVSIRQGALPFVRPAFEAWLFWPLAYLPYKAAFLLWALFSCGCLFAVAGILRAEIAALRVFSPIVMFAAMLSYFPVFITLLQGQDSILLLLVYAVAFRALRKGAPLASGMILGLGTFKFTLVLPFLIPFLVVRRIRVALGFALTSVVLAGVSIASVGWPSAAYYPKFLLSIDRLAPAVNVPKDMPNIRGLLSLLFHAGTLPAAGVLMLALLSVLLLAFAVIKFSQRSDGVVFDLGFGLNLAVTVLVSYHCHSFDLSILVVPITLVIALILSGPIPPQAGTSLMWGVGLIAFSPLYLVLSLALNYTSLLAVILLIFTFVLGFAISELKTRASGAEQTLHT